MSRSRFDGWQRARIRDALQVFHGHGFSHDDTPNTWESVSEAIYVTTGVKIPHERLRACVEGNDDGTGEHKRSWPRDPAHEQAIVEFLLDEELLIRGELAHHNPPVQAAMRLLEFLHDGLAGTAPRAAARGLEGVYRAAPVKIPDDGTVALTTLALKRPNAQGIMRATVVSDVLNSALFEHDDPPTDAAERAAARRGLIRHDGWAVLTPEDNLLIFVKHRRTGANRYYITVESDLSRDPDTPTTRLRLLEYDQARRPGLGEADPGKAEDPPAFLCRNLILFERDLEARTE